MRGDSGFAHWPVAECECHTPKEQREEKTERKITVLPVADGDAGFLQSLGIKAIERTQ